MFFAISPFGGDDANGALSRLFVLTHALNRGEGDTQALIASINGTTPLIVIIRRIL